MTRSASRGRLVAMLVLALCIAVLSPAGGAAKAAGSGTAGLTRVLVGFTPSGMQTAAAIEAAVGGRLVARLAEVQADVITVPAPQSSAALTALRGNPLIRYAQLDGIVRAMRTPDDEFWPGQWSSLRTDAPQAWDLTTGSPAVVVAVVDSGVDATQPDLTGRVLPGYNFVAGSTDTGDDDGHGTAVAGVIAAAGDNGIGVAGYCWQCSILPVKVLDSDGNGYDSALAEGILWAVDNGARVINTSLGGLSDDLTVAAAAQYAALHGVLVVAAAGNEGSSTLDYPAALPNVLSVGASDQSDQLYPWSNQGAAVSAPGENLTTGNNDGYVSFLGTSSAAPVVSGIAALAFSAVPSSTPAAVSQAIEATAVAAPGVHYGRVDAYAAIHLLAPNLVASAPAPVPVTTTLAGTGTKTGARGRHKVEAASAPVQHTIKGRLSRTHPSATVSLQTGTGLFEATVTVQPTPRDPVEFRLIRGTKSLVVRRSGRHRLTLHIRIPQGSYRLVLRKSASTASLSYRIAVTFPQAPKATQ